MVTGTSVHLWSSQEVTVITVVCFLVSVVNGQKVVKVVNSLVTVVTPVVTGTSVHLWSSQEVTVITVVEISVTVVLAKPAKAEPAVADNKATVENFIVSECVSIS